MISMFPIINDINNSTLRGVRAMPIKDSTSVGDSSFATDRHEYTRTYTDNPVTTAINPIRFGMAGFMNRGRINPTVFDGTHTAYQKKWINANRDASRTVEKKRVNATAIGSLNASNGPITFSSYTNKNDIIDAKIRCRSGGARVPVKCNNRLVALGGPNEGFLGAHQSKIKGT
jgi:hypothetical protein